MNDRRRRRIRAIAEVPQAAGSIRIGTLPGGFAYLLAAAWAAYRWLAARQEDGGMALETNQVLFQNRLQSAFEKRQSAPENAKNSMDQD